MSHLFSSRLAAIAVLVMSMMVSGNLVQAQAGETATVALTSSKQGWVKTDLSVRAGDRFLVAGTGTLNIGLPAPLEPRHLIWVRVGADGNIAQLIFNEQIIEATTTGDVYVSALWPANVVLGTPTGGLNAAFDMIPETKWDFSVELALVSKATPLEGAYKQAMQNAKSQKTLPGGFQPLWYLGASNVFNKLNSSTRRGVHVRTADDAGIIKTPLNMDLTRDTQIDFSWLYRALPARADETTTPHHDYMSLAVEFDNGQDITWFWSATLPPETIFRCPLPGWDKVETHIAVQSGQDGLGAWHSHTRNIYDDYEKGVGGEMPGKIVGVWVIGNAVFGRRQADAEFADVTIKNAQVTKDIFTD